MAAQDKNLRGATVLVAESDPFLRQALASVLQECECRVPLATSAASAHAIINKGICIDVAIIDVWLGDGWGPDLIPTLMQPPILCGGIVFLTGISSSTTDISRLYACGAQEVLHKSQYTLDDLVSAATAARNRTARLRAHAERLSLRRQSTILDARLPSSQNQLPSSLIRQLLLDSHEAQVAAALMREMSDKQIAATTGRSIATVKRTLGRLRKKLGVSTRGGIIARLLAARESTRRVAQVSVPRD